MPYFGCKNPPAPPSRSDWVLFVASTLTPRMSQLPIRPGLVDVIRMGRAIERGYRAQQGRGLSMGLKGV